MAACVEGLLCDRGVGVKMKGGAGAYSRLWLFAVPFPCTMLGKLRHTARGSDVVLLPAVLHAEHGQSVRARRAFSPALVCVCASCAHHGWNEAIVVVIATALV